MSARRSIPALSAAEKLRVARIERLADEGGEGVPALLEELCDPSWAVRREVVAALGRLGDVAAPALSAALRERRDDEIRLAALVDALVASTGSLVDQAVIALAGSPVPAVVSDAAQILGRRRSLAGIPTLAALTRAEDDNVAATAIEALGRIGGRAAVDSLIASAASGNFFRTFPAIDVLGRSGDPRVVGPLAVLLDDPRYANEAARALGRTGEKAAALPLARVLGRPGDRMARVVAVALAELYDRQIERHGVAVALDCALGEASSPVVVRRLVQAAAGADPDEQAAICRVLGALDDGSAAPFLTRLLDAPAPVAGLAAEALKKLGSSAEASLVAALQEGDSARRLVLLPLVSTRSRALSDVLHCLEDPEPAVRAAACDALARIGEPSAVPALFALLSDPNPRLVHAALGAIQSLGSVETEALTLAAARSADPQVRRAALRIIAYFGYASALDILVEAIAGDDDRLRDGALHALPALEDPRVMEALLTTARHADGRARAAAMRALGQRASDPEVVACLERGLADPDAWVRYYACQSLGNLAWEPAAGAIAALLQDEAGQNRVAAVEALSHLRSDAALAALHEAASSSEADMQRAALVGLGLGGRPGALPILLAAVTSPEPPTRLVAISALAAFDAPEVVPALARAAADPDEGVRTVALSLLAGQPTVAATQTLIDLLHADVSSTRIASALSVPSEGRIRGILSALESTDDDFAPRLVSALARMRHPDAAAALVSALSSPNVAARKAAVMTLGILGTPEALGALRQAAVGDADAEVRRLCALELSE